MKFFHKTFILFILQFSLLSAISQVSGGLAPFNVPKRDKDILNDTNSPQFKSRILKDGYPSGKKIHMVSGNNPGKPYVGFILNINTHVEDELILNGNFYEAFNIYSGLAVSGDLSAAHNLGLMLIRGLGASKDLKLGIYYLRESMASLDNFNTSKTYYDKAVAELHTK